MTRIRALWTRLFGRLYSGIANNLYEPVIVKIAFPLFGRDLPELVRAHGRRASALAKGRPILDLPVGTGYFATDMASIHEGTVVAADLAWGMAAKARSTDARLAVVQADGFHLPFPDDAFDVIVSSNGLQVMPDLAGAVAEMYRITAPRGTVLVALPTIPVGSLLPRAVSKRMPTFFRSGRDVADALVDAGYQVSDCRRSRLAYLIEAVRPA